MKKLREIRLMLHESDPDVFITVRKLAMLSLMEIFKDIIPGYRIRMLTQSEKQQKV
jgi:nucleolar complex protein 3